MEQAKIQLSAAEMRLVGDAELILTKNLILQKAKALFEEVQERMQQETTGEDPIFATGPKISRGEHYLGLPYFVLDYPRNFEKTGSFAIRSFFWWGRFFSSTLHLSGSYQEAFAPALAAAYPHLVQRNYFIQVGTDPWAHHFEAENYQPIQDFNTEAFAMHLHRHPQIKIAAKWPLVQWPHAANNFMDSWQFLLQVCNI